MSIDSHRCYGTVCIEQNFHEVVFVHSLMPQRLGSAAYPRNKVLLHSTWHLLHRYQLPMSSPTLPPLLPLVLHTPQHDSHLGGEEEGRRGDFHTTRGVCFVVTVLHKRTGEGAWSHSPHSAVLIGRLIRGHTLCCM